jgi:hypothetical protein
MHRKFVTYENFPTDCNLTQKNETYSKHKGTYNDTLYQRFARAVHQTGRMPFSNMQQRKHK